MTNTGDLRIAIKYKTYWEDDIKEYVCSSEEPLQAEYDFRMKRIHLIKSEGAKWMHAVFNGEEYDVLSPENYDKFERVLDTVIGSSARYC